ncbi:MAG: NYN domain-containing protein [Coriobacteriales bacterium]|jgi:predicted RNA-binding protein with PIN domain|nr:NYN domain-containing protein [Coriobacteriales bacterium]
MKLLLVDGYNVLRSSDLYSHLTREMPDHTHDAFNRARQALLGDVATFAGREYEATVVFDGGGNPLSTGEPRDVAGVCVIFSPAGTTADSVIEGLARTAVEQGREVLVVTSDAATQWTVLRKRVTRMSAAGFADEMRRIRQEVTETAEQQVGKTTLAQRLDARTRETLERLARGE